jgi:uncharacterized protein YdbL (DUF1318 family)
MTRLMLRLAGLALAVLVVPLGSAPAFAQSSPLVASARASGVVGERFDGYLGYAATPSRALRSQVDAINIRRRALYIALARRRSVSPQEVGIAAACQLFRRVVVGEPYMLNDGVWRRRGPGQPAPKPDYCG